MQNNHLFPRQINLLLHVPMVLLELALEEGVLLAICFRVLGMIQHILVVIQSWPKH